MKRLLVVMLFFSLALFSSCADKDTNAKDNKAPLTIKDYFSFDENTKYVYEGKGSEFASYKVFVDYLTESRIQLRFNNGGTETVKVLENKDGKLTMLLSQSECYYRDNLTLKAGKNEEILLQEPLIKGTSWTLKDGRSRYISNVEAETITPLGNYKTLEVTTEGKDYKILDYYAPNVGLVRTIFISNGFEVSSLLSKIEKNAVFTQNVKFYSPDTDGDKRFVTKQFSFHTNDITKDAFEKAFKDVIKVLNPNVKINSLFLNNDNIVYVDFSKELSSASNAGLVTEKLLLQCITNTLGEYYIIDNVYITIEGKPYSHDPYFTVESKN